MRCCPRRYASFAVDMFPTIFTLAFRQKEKFIATESGLRSFCPHLITVVPGILHDRSILKP